MPDAWSRTYPSGHRARITSFGAHASLEVFTASGDRLLDFALLLPSLELAQETADYVVNAQGESMDRNERTRLRIRRRPTHDRPRPSIALSPSALRQLLRHGDSSARVAIATI